MTSRLRRKHRITPPNIRPSTVDSQRRFSLLWAGAMALVCCSSQPDGLRAEGFRAALREAKAGLARGAREIHTLGRPLPLKPVGAMVTPPTWLRRVSDETELRPPQLAKRLRSILVRRPPAAQEQGDVGSSDPFADSDGGQDPFEAPVDRGDPIVAWTPSEIRRDEGSRLFAEPAAELPLTDDDDETDMDRIPPELNFDLPPDAGLLDDSTNPFGDDPEFDGISGDREPNGSRSLTNCDDEREKLQLSRIDSISLDIRVDGVPGEHFPTECKLADQQYESRNWPLVTYQWKSSSACHKPLYFEQVAAERHGHSVGPVLQPLVSGAHFFTSVVVLPYKMGLQTPNECVYVLGHYRPGSCAPQTLPGVPISLRAGLFQAGAVVGLAAAIP